MTAEQKFQAIEERYKTAFKNNNGYSVYRLYYKDGWVNMKRTHSSVEYKYRVSKIKQMCITLENNFLF